MTSRVTAEPVSSELMDALVQVSFLVMATLGRVATEHDLSLTQLRVLAILRDHEPKMAELATHLGLERSSVSGLIDRSAARGLVRRTVSRDDGRVVRVSLTTSGRRLATALAAQIDDLIAPMTDGLARSERQRLRVLLGKVLA